ncbi:hypothetical protein [Nitrospirillum bahiense]|uniref:hypothetical protein n=1 Tax=Nitrospirillum amazonense TaxID=28077 RepID=UPI0011A5E93D|nr:hypothetical protein [Nitrospirillum amazonense]
MIDNTPLEEAACCMPGGAYLDSAMKFRTTMSAQNVLRIGILAAGLALVHGAQAKTFEFRGHTLGEPIELSFPDWRNKDPYGIRGCHDEVVSGYLACPEKREAVDPRSSLGSYKIGDVEIDRINYDYYDGKLASIDVGFSIVKFETIRNMMEGKYGKPNRDEYVNTYGGYGLIFNNRQCDWSFPQGTLRLSLYYLDMHMSRIEFINPTVEAKIKKDKAAIDRQKGAKGF